MLVGTRSGARNRAHDLLATKIPGPSERPGRHRSPSNMQPQRASRGKISKAELARRLKISERHSHTLLRNGTASRDLAERIARHYGGEVEDYLRPPKRRGRTRPYVFREFINDKFIEDDKRAFSRKPEAREKLDDCDKLAAQ